MTLLSCSELRIDVDGVPLIDDLSCSAAGDRVALLGAWEPLFRLLGRKSAVTASGSLTIAGRDPAQSLIEGTLGLASYEPALPVRWSVQEYLARAGELAGLTPRAAQARAQAVLGDFRSAALGPRRIGSLGRAERRVLPLLQAVLTNPTALALEAPFVDLQETELGYVAWFFEAAARGRQVLFSVPSKPAAGPELNALESADEVLVLRSGRLSARGPASSVLTPGSRYRVTALSQSGELRRALEQRGCEVAAEPEPESAADPGASARFLVRLPDGASADLILQAAHETRAPVVEMVDDLL